MKKNLPIALCFSLIALLAWQLGGQVGYRQLEQHGRDEAFRYSQLISNEIKRYEPIVALAAQHPQLRQALNSPEQPQLIAAANSIMQTMATIVASSDVYLMDASGHTIAASNYQQSASFIGRNFAFRPYFRRAMANPGAPAFYFALGTTSRVRGLYFAQAVMPADGSEQPIGVITMKVQVTTLEQQWQRPDAARGSEMLITDAQGVSFLASRPDWRYRSIKPMDSWLQRQLVEEQRYDRQAITPLLTNALPTPWGIDAEYLMIAEQQEQRSYLSVSLPLPSEDWTLRVLSDTRPVFWTRILFLLVSCLLFAGLLLTWLYLRERHRREAELAERSTLLEQRVAERTADLEASNQQLLAEISERERAEAELKAAQQELIQAAKLAVLGQMSAGMNHELNQPLTAIQAYARNSQRFLQRGEQETVAANLGEIVNLCDTMAELTRQFKVFARKSAGLPSQVDLRQPIDAALKIIRAQDSSRGIQIDWQRPEQPVPVHGELIRIEQVLVNLIANAVHAVEAMPDGQISLEIQQDNGQITCHVRDNGPGLPADSEQLFEPFYTTKSMKQGLGLGLSISRQIMDALGGSLTGQNRRDARGADFILRFQPPRSAAQPAERS